MDDILEHLCLTISLYVFSLMISFLINFFC